jgi:hypothetical protein
MEKMIFTCNFPAFPESPECYLSKKVQITAFIREYESKPEIIAKPPDQIRILEQSNHEESPFSVAVEKEPVSLFFAVDSSFLTVKFIWTSKSS